MDSAFAISVRPAASADAAAAARVTAASIRELCRADHGGIVDLVARWTANKTPGQMRRWIADGPLALLLAERDGRVVGVGASAGEDEIALLYVDPDARFTGVSSALLAALEARLAPGRLRLASTATARRFYLARGWHDAAPPHWQGGMNAFPMHKDLG